MNRIALFFSFLLAMASACTHDFPEEPTNPSSAEGLDFTNFVAYGNSITAGYMDGALYRSGQQRNFPQILAQQFAEAKGDQSIAENFDVPLVASDLGFNSLVNNNPVGKLTFTIPDNCPSAGLTPVAGPGELPGPYAGEANDLNNYGIPGLRMLDLLLPASILSPLNPFYGRLKQGSSTTMLEQWLEADPTFFCLFLGNNDVLAYGAAGGTVVLGNNRVAANPDPPADPALHTPNDLTNIDVFRSALEQLVAGLLADGTTKGVICNLPYQTTFTLPDGRVNQGLSYFTLVNEGVTEPVVSRNDMGEQVVTTSYPFPLDEANATGLNQSYQFFLGVNPGFVAGTTNFPAIEAKDENNNVVVRLMNPAEDFLLLTLPTDSLVPAGSPLGPCKTGVGAGWGTVDINNMPMPIPDQYVLDKQEAQWARERTEAFNQVIAEVANANENLILIDMNDAFIGISAQDKSLTPGRLFSLDGIHPNGRGYARVANEIIRQMNEKFGVDINEVDVNDYQSNIIPN